MTTNPIDLHERNRASWNHATVAHNSHKVDQHLFFRNKGSTLYKEEKDLLGNLEGLKVCHLQCNAGQDTLSLVTKLGAQNPVGVDISDSAIEFATQLAKDAGIEATFVRADVFEFFDMTDPNQFDVVFTSYGTLGWLSSMEVSMVTGNAFHGREMGLSTLADTLSGFLFNHCRGTVLESTRFLNPVGASVSWSSTR
jgi:SAM-dependent methyltransferase